MIQQLIKTARLAGEEILKIYETDFGVEYKNDSSPVTEADFASNKLIEAQLKEKFPDIPILSEESAQSPYEERKTWKKAFVVDPLDGTKEFISRNGEFTVNIGYIENGQPISGVVYAPARDLLYYSDGEKSYFQDKEIQVKSFGETLLVVASRSHFTEETRAFVEQFRKPYELLYSGSAIKLCRIASGEADLYPRCAPTMEWDTAAGHAIVRTAGGQVVDIKTGKELQYNKEDLLNPWFVASVSAL